MHKLMSIFVVLGFLISFSSAQAAEMKEWTFLNFINGNNNLDSFGAMNINSMEEVGSNDQINIVVQWASMKRKTVQRLLVVKDTNTSKVTSPVVQDLGQHDMGDYKNLIEFVRWAHEKYPAKRYFLNVWNHGNGWHRQVIDPRDISYDDFTNNKITTEQLGMAMKEISLIIGHKIDIYGSDACLMAMAEIASEMSEYVKFFVGSQELEPGAGWPYADLLQRWVKNPTAEGNVISKILSEEYVKAYSGGVYGNDDVTFSAFDLAYMDQYAAAIKDLGSELSALGDADVKKVMTAASNSQNFYLSDYVDVLDFTKKLTAANVSISANVQAGILDVSKKFIIANNVTSKYKNATGSSFWLPLNKSVYSKYSDRYSKLRFNYLSNWAAFLAKINK